MGTKASTADEWIELKNNTSSAIVLTGWTLSWGSITIHFSEIADDTKEIRTSTIPANGFYLLERTDDDTIKDIYADLIYKGTLGNSGEHLILKDGSGATIDGVDASTGWFAGTTSPDYRSMERIDPTASGSDPINWATNNGIIRNGLDASGNPVNGTPKARNLAKKGDINGDGIVNMLDARLVLQYTLGLINLTDEQKRCADVAAPRGTIDINDAILIAEVAIGMKDSSDLNC